MKPAIVATAAAAKRILSMAALQSLEAPPARTLLVRGGDSSMRGTILERDFGALAAEMARKKLIQLLSGEKLLLLVFQSLLGFGIAF